MFTSVIGSLRNHDGDGEDNVDENTSYILATNLAADTLIKSHLLWVSLSKLSQN